MAALELETGITAVNVSLMWHGQDTITMHKSAVQLRDKQTCFAIHSSLYISNEILPAIPCSHMRIRNQFPKS